MLQFRLDPGLEFYGEVVGEYGDLLDKFFNQSIIELCDLGFLIGDGIVVLLVFAFSRRRSRAVFHRIRIVRF